MFKIFYLLVFFLIFQSNQVFSASIDKFTIDQSKLIYDTENIEDWENAEINQDDPDIFFQLLSENPQITTVQLNSAGGLQADAYEISDLIIDFDLDTHVNGVCHSSCTILFLAGNKRTVERGSTLGFHQLHWPAESQRVYYDYYLGTDWNDEFEYAEWLYNDAQATILLDMEYLLERGVESYFAIKTLQADPNDMWIPRRKELINAGVIIE
tara:strand:+ start:98 stop:730 length:633 start_codon:yes stop_codon:yes gene_type:complete